MQLPLPPTNRLLDLLPKHQLFYCIGLFYFFTFTCVAWMLSSKTYGLPNTNADPSRLLGERPQHDDTPSCSASFPPLAVLQMVQEPRPVGLQAATPG
jgi:hypothetical protein